MWYQWERASIAHRMLRASIGEMRDYICSMVTVFKHYSFKITNFKPLKLKQQTYMHAPSLSVLEEQAFSFLPTLNNYINTLIYVNKQFNECIDLFLHYTHSLQIMKIKKYFFSTLVCIYLFFGGGVGSSTATSFFSTTIIYCVSYACQTRAYQMHAKVHFCV